jgi:hypothetical protein
MNINKPWSEAIDSRVNLGLHSQELSQHDTQATMRVSEVMIVEMVGAQLLPTYVR